MNLPKHMLVANVAWAAETMARDPHLFEQLTQGQSPKVLWLGCSDSRVPAETITHCQPGDLFVHRNIANLFQPDDDNGASVLEYAVKVLKVGHVIVCGHYGCGGVRAALLPPPDDLPHVKRRIAPLCALADRHRADIDAQPDETTQINRLAELNVLEQVRQLRADPIVRDMSPAPLVHGWIFSLDDGRIKVLASGYPQDDTNALPGATSTSTAAAPDALAVSRTA
ncbi:carbonic anhydrase [Paraburkholderia sp.]|uniref:carbonic anhydrase n=1 Tax=Paraburkholderia sp. TaxID=1926495 RepID=UPI002384B504|nr:carbonic anhydrase [Paraburkholderia sp.]MDE1182741.1 carbonic anhydrase [Paraburkholderia sp.]